MTKGSVVPDRITLMLNIEYEGNRGGNDGNHDGNEGNRDGYVDGNLSEMEICIFSVIKENNTLSAKKYDNVEANSLGTGKASDQTNRTANQTNQTTDRTNQTNSDNIDDQILARMKVIPRNVA